MQIQDITGQTFGRWAVLKFYDTVTYKYTNGSSTATRWLCRCECGAEKVVRGQSLKDGSSVSCRCYQREFQRQRQTKHGMFKSPEYAAWAHMMDRCKNPQNPAFADYGGRGITVCERWKTASNFLVDMGERPSLRHSLERIDNERGYSPDNCRWATSPEQCNNTRKNRRLRFNSRVLTVAQWAKHLGLKKNTIHKRLDLGWSTNDTLSIPISKDKAGWEARRTRKLKTA